MSEQWPETKKRTEEYLAVIVRGIQSVGVKNIGSYETLEFIQQFREGKSQRVFPASSMSDGTLRALGILMALFQKGETGNSPISLAGIEEPETGLHPAATGALLDAIGEASESKQILITSHSAELLDNKNLTADMLIAVVTEEGITKLGSIDEASRSVMRDHLFTAGELLRGNQLAPEQNGIAYDKADKKPIREASAA